MSNINHHIFDWQGPQGLPEFSQITDGDFATAFAEALARHERQIDAIATNPSAATFENTIVALEQSGQALERVSALFWNKAGADSNDAIHALERDMAPRLSRHFQPSP